jgi:hypothetical protein
VAIEHLVMMKICKVLPEPKLQELCRECEAQLEKIPGVVSISMGANFGPGNSEFTHGLVIRFEDKKALEGFMPHPNHVAAGTRLQEFFSDFLILDYETERG